MLTDLVRCTVLAQDLREVKLNLLPCLVLSLQLILSLPLSPPFFLPRSLSRSRSLNLFRSLPFSPSIPLSLYGSCSFLWKCVWIEWRGFG